MLTKIEKEKLKQLLSDTLLLLCQNSLPLRTNFSIEALVGVTLENDEILLVSLKENVNGVKEGDKEEESNYDLEIIEDKKDNKGGWREGRLEL